MEGGLELNGTSKKTLAALKRASITQVTTENEGIKLDEEPASFSEIKEEADLHDQQINRGLENLQEKGLIEKLEEKGPYRISSDYKDKVVKLARRERDTAIIDSYPHTHVISLTSSNPSVSTSVYGLETEKFRSKDGLSLSLDVEETRQFQQGITSPELFGKQLGVPMKLKHRENLEEMTEEEIIELQVEYYKDLYDKPHNTVEELIRDIIRRHRQESIQFKEVGKNIISKLENLRKEAAYSSVKEDYDELLAQEDLDEDVEEVLIEFKEELLGILEQVSGALPGAIFIMHGRGCGIANRWPEDMNQEEVDSRIQEFGESVDSLFPDSKSKSDFMPYRLSEGIDKEDLGEKQLELIEFLEKIWKRNIDLYGIHASFFARRGKGIYTDVPVRKDDLARLDQE